MARAAQASTATVDPLAILKVHAGAQRAGTRKNSVYSKASVWGGIGDAPVAAIVDFLLVPFTLAGLQRHPRRFTIDPIRSKGALRRARQVWRALLMPRNKVPGLLHPHPNAIRKTPRVIAAARAEGLAERSMPGLTRGANAEPALSAPDCDR